MIFGFKLLSKYTIEALSKTLPLRQEVRAYKKKDAADASQVIGPTPEEQVKRPWVAEVNGQTLDDPRQSVYRYESEMAAVTAAQKYVKSIIDETIGYYWQVVHLKTNEVVNSGFTAGFGNDVPGSHPGKTPGFEMRTIAVYRTPLVEI